MFIRLNPFANEKKELMPIFLVLLASTVLIISQNPSAFAQIENGTEPLDPVITEFTADKDSYVEGDTIKISGHIENHWPSQPVTINIDTNTGSQPSFNAKIYDNGDFEATTIAGGDEWSKPGTYTLRVMHVAGSFVAYTTFEYTPPEPPPVQITEETYITTDKKEYTYSEPIIILGNIGDLQFPIKIDAQCDIMASPSTFITLNAFGTASHEVRPDGNFEYKLGTLGCLGQTSTATIFFQGTDIKTTFQMIGEEPQEVPETTPTTTILSFDIDIQTRSDLQFPVGRLHGQTSQGGEGLFIVLRDPDGSMVWNHPRIPDSNGYFDYRFDIGNPTVLVNEGTFTAIAHLYTETEEEGIRVTFDNFFQQEPEPEPEVEISIHAPDELYYEGDTIVISGEVSSIISGLPLTIEIFHEGDLVEITQLNVSQDGEFAHTILAQGPLWLDGSYVIEANYGEAFEDTFFEFVTNEPEPEPEPEDKVTICHFPSGNYDNPQTLTISENELTAHLQHGDTFGQCQVKSSHGLVSLTAGSSVPGCEETNECYVPYQIRIDQGEEIRWFNGDSAAHTVTSGTPQNGPDGNFDSSLFMAGDFYSHKFEQEGQYPYFCMVHPWMVGSVVVGDGEFPELHPKDVSPEPDLIPTTPVLIPDGEVSIPPTPAPEPESEPEPPFVVFDDATGGDCEYFGEWNRSSKTCTLTQDLFFDGINGIIIGDEEERKPFPIWTKTVYYGKGQHDFAILRVNALIPDELMAFGERYPQRKYHPSESGISGTSLSPEEAHERIDSILMEEVDEILNAQGSLERKSV